MQRKPEQGNAEWSGDGSGDFEDGADVIWVAGNIEMIITAGNEGWVDGRIVEVAGLSEFVVIDGEHTGLAVA